MIWFILGALCAVIGAALIVVGNVDVDDETWRTRSAGVVLAAIGVVLLLLSSTYTQDPGEVVLIRGAGGSVEDVDRSAGFGFTAPWNKQSRWNTRLQRIELAGSGDGLDGPAVPVSFEGGSGGTIGLAFVYSIPGDHVEAIFNEHRNQDKLEENRLVLALKDTTATSASRFDPFTIRQQRSELQADIQDALTEELSDEVTVERIELGNINLPDETEAALNRVNERRAEVEEARANLDRARIDANTTRTEAQASADADQIARCGATTRTATQEIAGEEVEIVEVIPRDNNECQNRLNEQVLISKWIEALTQLGEQGNVIVVPDDPSSILDLPVPSGNGG